MPKFTKKTDLSQPSAPLKKSDPSSDSNNGNHPNLNLNLKGLTVSLGFFLHRFLDEKTAQFWTCLLRAASDFEVVNDVNEARPSGTERAQKCLENDVDSI